MLLYNLHNKDLHNSDRKDEIPEHFWHEITKNSVLNLSKETLDKLAEKEKYIAKNGKYSYWYSLATKKRFKLGEPAIAKSSYAIDYVRNIIKDVWPEGEARIAKSAFDSYSYAINFLKKRFPEGEKAIAEDPYYAIKYVKRFKVKSELLEKSIAQDAFLAVEYAIDNKQRFIAGEETISKNANIAVDYAIRVLKHRWPEAEPTILEKAYETYSYTIALVKGRWPEGEKVMKKRNTYFHAYKIHLQQKYPEDYKKLMDELKADK